MPASGEMPALESTCLVGLKCSVACPVSAYGYGAIPLPDLAHDTSGKFLPGQRSPDDINSGSAEKISRTRKCLPLAKFIFCFDKFEQNNRPGNDVIDTKTRVVCIRRNTVLETTAI